MLTARGFDIEPKEMIDAGIAAVLAKPFSPREVLEKVSGLLDGTEAHSVQAEQQ
jgi:DNA-binding response OmpR family regulator